MADRYMYIPSIGLFFIVAYGFDHLMKNASGEGACQFAGKILLIIITVGFFLLTAQRCRVWQNGITLWTDVIRKYPRVDIAYNNRGNAYSLAGLNDLALSDYNRVIALNPNNASAYSNKGYLLFLNGKYDLAIEEYKKSLRIYPRFITAYLNRAIAYRHLGLYDLAMKDVNEAIQIDPSSTSSYYQRSLIYQSMGKYQMALDDAYRARLPGSPSIIRPSSN